MPCDTTTVCYLCLLRSLFIISFSSRNQLKFNSHILFLQLLEVSLYVTKYLRRIQIQIFVSYIILVIINCFHLYHILTCIYIFLDL